MAQCSGGAASFAPQTAQIRAKLKIGYHRVFAAQAADNEGEHDEALELYFAGSKAITKVLSMRCRDPEIQAELEKANFVLSMAKHRIRDLIEKNEQEAANVNQPSAPPSSSDEGLDEMSDLLDDIDDIHAILESASEAKEVMSIDQGVSMFEINNGEVIQKGKNASAKISHVISDTPSSNGPISFMQIGEMLYPLVSNTSPVLQVGEKQFMFPSLEQSNKYIGVVLENVSQEKVAEFQRLIMSLTNLHVKSWDDIIEPGRKAIEAPARPPPPSTVSVSAAPSQAVAKPYLQDPPVAKTRKVDQVSHGIEVTAEVLAAGVVWGSQKGGVLIKKGADKLKEKYIKPSTRDVQISDNTKQQVATIRTSSAQVCQLTGQAVSHLATGVSALAKMVAPHVTKGVKHVINKSDNKYVGAAKSRISEQNVKDACQVGTSALSGLFVLYEGLEEGAKELGRAMATGANVTVGQRYGEDAGQITEDSLHAVGNVGLTYNQAKKLGGKALVKRAAKNTAAEVVRHNAGDKGPVQK